MHVPQGTPGEVLALEGVPQLRSSWKGGIEGEAGMERKARVEGEAAVWQAPAGQGG